MCSVLLLVPFPFHLWLRAAAVLLLFAWSTAYPMRPSCWPLISALAGLLFSAFATLLHLANSQPCSPKDPCVVRDPAKDTSSQVMFILLLADGWSVFSHMIQDAFHALHFMFAFPQFITFYFIWPWITRGFSYIPDISTLSLNSLKYLYLMTVQTNPSPKSAL